MSKIRFASASLLALGLLFSSVSCVNPTNTPGDLAPYRGDWEEVANWPFYLTASSTINIGGRKDSDNFANRGNIEVYYSLDTDQIIIQMRKFTFADDDATAADDYAKMSAWINVGSKVPTEELDPEDACMYTDPENGEQLWQENCGVHLYYDGQTQKLRVGADIRVFLPKTFEGLINVVTEDNVAELEDYPDRGDVTIVGLPGSADIEVDSAIVQVILADGTEPVPACTADLNQQCADVGWDTMDPMCTACVDFGRVHVTTRGEQPIQATIDGPANLWINVTMKNSAPGLVPSSDPLCEATIDCDDFGDDGCFWIDNDIAKPFNRRAELNKPDAALEGLGYNINVEAGACAVIEAVEGPDDYEMPGASLRGELRMCTGCLDIPIPAP